jgi:uncharacterized low-complexity protein
LGKLLGEKTMSDKKVVKPVALAVGAALASTFAIADVANADGVDNPFAISSLTVGYMLGAGEGSCGGDKEGKEGEGSCGGDKEGKDGEGSCGEGSCGGDKEGEAEDKEGEGSCGEGSCGGDKSEGEGSCGGDKEDKDGEGSCGGSV